MQSERDESMPTYSKKAKKSNHPTIVDEEDDDMEVDNEDEDESSDEQSDSNNNNNANDERLTVSFYRNAFKAANINIKNSTSYAKPSL